MNGWVDIAAQLPARKESANKLCSYSENSWLDYFHCCEKSAFEAPSLWDLAQRITFCLFPEGKWRHGSLSPTSLEIVCLQHQLPVWHHCQSTSFLASGCRGGVCVCVLVYSYKYADSYSLSTWSYNNFCRELILML